ncbi:hypothetical protein PMAYCL1PPCAC_21399, partial [Pristionchus mayeri]
CALPIYSAAAMVDAVVLEANTRKPEEIIIRQQIADYTPPESQRNSTEDSNDTIECRDESEHVEIEMDDEELIVDENRVPPIGGEEEIAVDVGKHCDEPPATPSSISDIISLHGGYLSPSILATASPSLTVAGAVASDKAKQRAIATAIEKYVEKRGGNLYPTREDKEKMAEDLSITYNQVNRWFANRRRKVTKHRKILGCATPVMQRRDGTEEKERDIVDECIESIIEETRRKRRADDDIESEMVAHNAEGLPVADEGQYCQDQSMVPPPGASATAALLAAAIAQGQASQISPILLASLMSNPQITAHLLQQVMHQQVMHAQLAHHQQQLYATQAALASPVHHQLPVNSHGQPNWMSPPISESPLEELSDHSSDFSPRPSSPRFKDPHNIADPQMAKLLAASDLSERESIAISVLIELGNIGY